MPERAGREDDPSGRRSDVYWELMARLSQLALTIADVDAFLEAACDALKSGLGVSHAFVYEVGPAADLTVLTGVPSRVLTSVPSFAASEELLEGRALREDGPIALDDDEPDDRARRSPLFVALGLRCAVLVAVRCPTAPPRIVCVGAVEPRRFRETDLSFVEAVASVIAVATERSSGERRRLDLLERLVSARDEERRTIARELHDHAGSALASLLVGFRVIEAAESLEAAKAHVRTLRASAKAILDDLTQLARGMYPTSLDDFGLEEAVRNGIVAVCEGHGLDVTFSSAGFQARLPSHLELTLFRIAQEAVTNVVKHAEATQVTITLERTADFAVLSVSDDGCGFEPSEAHAPGRLGLAGMRERAKLVGGTLGVETSRGLGVNIVATIPVPRLGSEGAG